MKFFSKVNIHEMFAQQAQSLYPRNFVLNKVSTQEC